MGMEWSAIYGVCQRETSALKAQLGLELGPKSKIRNGSAMGRGVGVVLRSAIRHSTNEPNSSCALSSGREIGRAAQAKRWPIAIMRPSRMAASGLY